MALNAGVHTKPREIDKSWLRRQIEERHGRLPAAKHSAAAIRDMMVSDGVDPMRNEFSTEIIRARYEGS